MKEQNINYQKELEKIIDANQKAGRVPTLFLHSCCAPCSSYCLEYLAEYFHITLFYYNPNISPQAEYEVRAREQGRLIEQMNQNVKYPMKWVLGSYEPERFYQMAKGHEEEKEGGERCFLCYQLRLFEAANQAKEGGFDYFTTTLSISPLKNAKKLNEIGNQIAAQIGIAYLPSDFKKKNGYKRSVALSAEYGLYRQDYCGCIYSKMEREASKN